MGWLRSFATDGSDLAKPSWSVDETSATMAWLPSLPFSASETVLGQRGPGPDHDAVLGKRGILTDSGWNLPIP